MTKWARLSSPKRTVETSAEAEARRVGADFVERDLQQVCRRRHGRAHEKGEVGETAAAAFVDMAGGEGGFPRAVPRVDDGGGADRELFVAGFAGVVIGAAGDGEAEGLAVGLGLLGDVARDAGRRGACR